MMYDTDLVDAIRAGEPLMIVLTPAQRLRIRREIAIRESIEHEEDRRELERRRRDAGLA